MTLTEQTDLANLRIALAQLPFITHAQVMILADCGKNKAREIMADCDSYGKGKEKKTVDPKQVIAWIKRHKVSGGQSQKSKVAKKTFLTA